jgi:hypothetical protein
MMLQTLRTRKMGAIVVRIVRRKFEKFARKRAQTARSAAFQQRNVITVHVLARSMQRHAPARPGACRAESSVDFLNGSSSFQLTHAVAADSTRHKQNMQPIHGCYRGLDQIA